MFRSSTPALLVGFLWSAAFLEMYVFLVSRRFSSTEVTKDPFQVQIPTMILQETYPDESTRSFVDFLANNGFSEAVDSTHYPIGVYDASSDTTFIAYQGPHEDPYVVSFEHRTKTWRGPVKVGTSMLGQVPDPMPEEVDEQSRRTGTRLEGSKSRQVPMYRPPNNNGKPSMIIDSLGYLHMSYGGDGGDPMFRKRLGPNQHGDYGTGRQIHLRSKEPYNISEWLVMKGSKLSWYGVNAQFVRVDSELYHFVNHGSCAASVTVQRSIDDGKSWSDAQPILQTSLFKSTHPVNDTWHCRFRGSNYTTRGHVIGALCTYQKRTNSTSSAAIKTRNMYYLELDTHTQQWLNAQGAVLRIPLTKESADEHVRVIDTKQRSHSSSILFPMPGSLAWDHLGHPQLLIRASMSPGSPGNTNGATARRALMHMQWNGSHWEAPNAITAGLVMDEDLDGDIAVSDDGSLEVIFSSTNDARASVQTWTSYNQGVSWEHGTELMSLRGHGTFHNSALILNGRPDARIVAYLQEPNEHLSGMYRKMYLMGDNGPIPRKRAEADLCRGIKLKDHGSICTSVKGPKSRIRQPTEGN